MYKTKFWEEGIGVNNYYYFKDNDEPICQGIKDINSHLKNINRDFNVIDKDAFFVLTGRLKFFDFFDKNDTILDYKNIIEFIDLPGLNVDSSRFNEKGYYNKVLKFTDCSVYINDLKTIKDEDSKAI